MGRTLTKRTRLQARIARHIALAVVISLVASAFVLVVFRHRAVRRNMETSARTYTSLVSEPLVTLITFFGSSGKRILDQRVTELRRLNNDVVRLEIVNVRGDVVLRAEGDNVFIYGDGTNSPTVDDRDLLRAVAALEPSADSIVESSGSRVYRVVAPVVNQWGVHHFSLVGTFSYANVDAQLRNSLWLLALVLVLGLGLAQWLAMTLAREITRDVERLREGVQRIREGHLRDRVVVDSRDEIEELADAFNAMAVELLATIERLREANRELESLDQTKANLLANVSHELRTPLTALRGYLELMTDGELGEISEQASRAAMICRKNVQRLSLRVEELVQLSRFERYTSLDASRESVDLGALLESVIDSLRPRLEDSGIDVAVRIASDVEPLNLNSEQMERVLFNLLDNAIKFSPSGGSIIAGVEECTHEGRSGTLVRVQDSGIGIPSSELIRIFDRFHQVDPSSRRRYGGMGLGLALVRSIVEAHLGVVWAESEQDLGSTFFVWLPRLDAPSQRASAHGPSGRLDSTRARGLSSQEG